MRVPAFPTTLSSLPAGSILPEQNFDTVAPPFENMYAIHSNIQLEKAITQNLSFAVGHVHSEGRRIPRYKLEVFGEFQNVFNINSIVQFNNVTVTTNPTTGELVGELPDFRARNQSTSQESRQFQLGFKFIF